MLLLASNNPYAGLWPLLVIGGVMLVIIAVLGGAVTAAVARSATGFVMGVVAYVATAWWLRVRCEVPGEQALVFGFFASAAVGGLLAAADRLPRRRHGWWRAAAVLLVLSLAVLAVRSGLRHEHRFDAALDPSVVVVVS